MQTAGCQTFDKKMLAETFKTQGTFALYSLSKGFHTHDRSLFDYANRTTLVSVLDFEII